MIYVIMNLMVLGAWACVVLYGLEVAKEEEYARKQTDELY